MCCCCCVYIGLFLLLCLHWSQHVLLLFISSLWLFTCCGPCRTQTLHFSFLNGDKHPHWMPSLLRSTNDALPSEGQWDEEEGEEPPDYAGHVLALNGHRKYFCLFRPVFTGEDPDRPEASGPGDRRKSRSRSRSSSHSRSRSREDGPGPKRGRATSIEVHHKLDRLGLWMERLMEGTLPRLQVPAWPPLGEASSSSSWTPSHH